MSLAAEEEHVELPPGVDEEKLKAYLLYEWETPRRNTKVRRLIYKLQRSLHIYDIWILPELGEDVRLREKKKLLLTLQRFSREGLLSPPKPDEDRVPEDVANRKFMLRKLRTLSPEDLEVPALEPLRGRQAPRYSGGPRPGRRPRNDMWTTPARADGAWSPEPVDDEISDDEATAYPSRRGFTPAENQKHVRRLQREEFELNELARATQDRRARAPRGRERQPDSRRRGANRGERAGGSEEAREERERYWRDRDAAAP